MKQELNWVIELKIFEPWDIKLAIKTDTRNILWIKYISFIM